MDTTEHTHYEDAREGGMIVCECGEPMREATADEMDTRDYWKDEAW